MEKDVRGGGKGGVREGSTVKYGERETQEEAMMDWQSSKMERWGQWWWMKPHPPVQTRHVDVAVFGFLFVYWKYRILQQLCVHDFVLFFIFLSPHPIICLRLLWSFVFLSLSRLAASFGCLFELRFLSISIFVQYLRYLPSAHVHSISAKRPAFVLSAQHLLVVIDSWVDQGSPWPSG